MSEGDSEVLTQKYGIEWLQTSWIVTGALFPEGISAIGSTCSRAKALTGYDYDYEYTPNCGYLTITEESGFDPETRRDEVAKILFADRAVSFKQDHQHEVFKIGDVRGRALTDPLGNTIEEKLAPGDDGRTIPYRPKSRVLE